MGAEPNPAARGPKIDRRAQLLKRAREKQPSWFRPIFVSVVLVYGIINIVIKPGSEHSLTPWFLFVMLFLLILAMWRRLDAIAELIDEQEANRREVAT